MSNPNRKYKTMQEEMNAFKQSGLQEEWQRANNEEKAKKKAIENSIPYKIKKIKNDIEFLQIQINTLRYSIGSHTKQLLNLINSAKKQNLSNSNKEFKKFHENEIKKFKNETDKIRNIQDKLKSKISTLELE